MHNPLPVPPALSDWLKDWSVNLAYSYGPETATWRLRRGGQTRYLKIVPLGWEPSLACERDRMHWAANSRLPVPQVIGHGVTEGVEWLLTTGLPGMPATNKELAAEPAALVPLLAQGLRALHETPARDCPFSFRLTEALTHVRRRVVARAC